MQIKLQKDNVTIGVCGSLSIQFALSIYYRYTNNSYKIVKSAYFSGCHKDVFVKGLYLQIYEVCYKHNNTPEYRPGRSRMVYWATYGKYQVFNICGFRMCYCVYKTVRGDKEPCPGRRYLYHYHALHHTAQ